MNHPVDPKKRILFVIASLGRGGAERVLVHLLNNLDRTKYDVRLVLFENIQGYQKDLDPSVDLICLNIKKRLDYFKIPLGLGKIIKDYDPQYVVSFLDVVNNMVIISRLFVKKKFKVILSERNHPDKALINVRIRWVKKLLKRFTYPMADRIISVSKETEMVLKEKYKVSAEKLITISNPVPIELIRSKQQEKIDHPFFQDDNVQVIISAGRLTQQKRHDRLLRAFSSVKKEHDRVRLIILGEGELLHYLQDLAKLLKIEKSVDFVGFRANPYAWFSKSDLFVLSSDFEGFPNVLVEAMACGIPVISTNCTSSAGVIITDGNNGVLVPLEDEAKLGESMLKLLRDEKLRATFISNGTKKVEEFSVHNIIAQYEKCFD